MTERNKFRRLLRYLYVKIIRDRGTPEYIARGWGIGMFVGCVVPMSFQLMISLPLSFLLRGSKIGAGLGTLLTNPVTVIFIYPAQCWAGNKIIGGDLSYHAITEALKQLLEEKSWHALLSMSTDLIVSFFLGGVLLALVCTPITYYTVYHMVVKYRAFKAAREQKQSLEN